MEISFGLQGLTKAQTSLIYGFAENCKYMNHKKKFGTFHMHKNLFSAPMPAYPAGPEADFFV